MELLEKYMMIDASHQQSANKKRGSKSRAREAHLIIYIRLVDCLLSRYFVGRHPHGFISLDPND